MGADHVNKINAVTNLGVWDFAQICQFETKLLS